MFLQGNKRGRLKFRPDLRLTYLKVSVYEVSISAHNVVFDLCSPVTLSCLIRKRILFDAFSHLNFRKPSLVKATVHNAFFVTVFKSLHLHLSMLETEPFSKHFTFEIVSEVYVSSELSGVLVFLVWTIGD